MSAGFILDALKERKNPQQIFKQHVSNKTHRLIYFKFFLKTVKNFYFLKKKIEIKKKNLIVILIFLI